MLMGYRSHRGLCSLGHGLIEGAAFGVDFVQGYHVGRPARVEELLPLRWA